MTKLEYSVKSCIHNADSCHCKTAITMGGSKAKSSKQTCHTSFGESKGARFTNLFKTPETGLEVVCDTVRCVYNEGHRCSAERINISRDGVCDYAETKCNTFKARQECRGCRGSEVSLVSMWNKRRGRKRTRGDRGL